MARGKTVSNEALIAALLEYGTVSKAADAVGLAPRSVYDRFQDKDFQSDYTEAKTDAFRGGVLLLNRKLESAITVISEIAEDKDVNAAVRLQAAGLLIKSAAAFNAALGQTEAQNRDFRSPYSIFV